MKIKLREWIENLGSMVETKSAAKIDKFKLISAVREHVAQMREIITEDDHLQPLISESLKYIWSKYYLSFSESEPEELLLAPTDQVIVEVIEENV